MQAIRRRDSATGDGAMSVELLNWDCMLYMATLEDNAFELAICD